MKGMKENTAVKVGMAVLCIVSAAVATVCLVLLLVCMALGSYNDLQSTQPIDARNVLEERMEQDLSLVAHGYYPLVQEAQANTNPAREAWYQEELRVYEEQFDPANTSFRFAILDETGEQVMGTYTGEPALVMTLYSLPDTDRELYGYVAADLVMGDDYIAISASVQRLNDVQPYLFPVLVGCLILCLVLLALLMTAAGHRREEDGIVLRLLDRMPWDAFVCLWVTVWCLCAVGVVELSFYFFDRTPTAAVLHLQGILLVFAAVAAGCALVGVVTMMSVAARLKVKGWWKNSLILRFFFWIGRSCRRGAGAVSTRVKEKTLEKAEVQGPAKPGVLPRIGAQITRFFRWLWGGIKNLLGRGGAAVQTLPMMWKAVLFVGIVLVLEVVCLWCAVDSVNVLPGILLNGILAVILLWASADMKKLQAAARAIADGDLDYRVDTSRMRLDFKAHGEDLNRIGDGLTLAVEDRLKSERMKTELITNVSHDLKTPLTSIVSYVDLLKKEELPEKVAEYVAVLDRQSARLKKLTEDLVEASKASTGNLHVALESVDLGEFLEQAQAEYAARLLSAELEVVAQPPAGPLLARSDGRYLWRIMDNLLGNACKYAMSGTRVYLAAERREDRAVLSVKNISRERLNISADELMERFVRGDSSRNTEGSGLGLSIAQSLAALMGGKLELTVDGDLFKAEVFLPLAEAAEN